MFDLESRLSRIEKEQSKRRQDAKKKLQIEQQMQLRIEENQARREMESQRRREEAEREEARLRWEAEEEFRVTGGVAYESVLEAYAMEGDDDKVKLPEDALQRLSSQDAFSRGALTFRLQLDGHRSLNDNLLPNHHGTTNSIIGPTVTTFCGVREFSSPGGKIGLPPKVIRSLQLTGNISIIGSSIDSPAGQSDTDSAVDGNTTRQLLDTNSTNAAAAIIRIKYMILPKCVFARLRPREHRFFDVSLVKLCLEENLRHHSALSVGDELSVWSRGVEHHLVVTELKPERHCSLVNTDVEIEMELSEEYTALQQQLSGQQQQSDQQQEGKDKVGDHSRTLNSNTAAPTTATISEGVVATGASQSSTDHVLFIGDPSHEKLLEYYSHQLRPEPPLNLTTSTVSDLSLSYPEAVLSLKIKLPDGASRVRRFHADTSIYELFLFSALQLLSSSSPNSSVVRTVLAAHPPVNADGAERGVSSDNIVDRVLSRLQVSTRFPARCFKFLDPRDNTQRTFQQLGMMASSSDIVFVTFT